MAGLSLADKRIVVTGGAGFLGRQVIAQLLAAGATEDKISVPRSRDRDLRQLQQCQEVVQGQDIIIHLAAHVGGIGLNREKPAELFYDNLMMGTQLIHAAYEAEVEKFVCVWVRFAPIPNLPRFPSGRMTSGMAIPKKRTPPMGLPKKPC